MSDWDRVEAALREWSAALGEALRRPPEPEPDGTMRWPLPAGEWVSRPWLDPHGILMSPLAPGIYIDELGALRVNIPELARIVGLPETEGSMRVITGLVRGALEDARIDYGGELT